MSRFNLKTKKVNRTVNLAGGEAFIESPELEFISILLTSFVQNQYYRTADKGISRLKELIDSIADKKFLAKTAIFARTKFGMRSISHVVAGELAKRVKGELWTKNFYEKVIYRPDDIAEILAYYCNNYGKPIPNSLKKGLALAFNKFNEYQLAKYRGEKSAFSLVDMVNLLHPKVKEELQPALKALVAGTLRSKDTWETELTQAGQKAQTLLTEEEKEEVKAEVWTKLIKEQKIGYFALLRNLRNILEQSPEVVESALELLVDEKLIRKSLVLPFRFITAIEQIEESSNEKTRKVLIALNKAVEISLSNVPKLKGRTLVVLDGSGSMTGQPIKIGSLFAAVLFRSNNADYMTFSDNAKYVIQNPLDSLLTIAKRMENDIEGAGTNFHAIFKTANQNYDRIIILSDMQGWIDYEPPTKTLAEYKLRTGSNPIIYSFNLRGYGTLQFPEKNVCCLVGFSEKVFEIMKLLETDKQALLHEIGKIDL